MKDSNSISTSLIPIYKKKKMSKETKQEGKAVAAVETKQEKHDEKQQESPYVSTESLPKMKKTDGDEHNLPINEKFMNRWMIQGLIGKGGYGEIYLAVDVIRGEERAIKVEPKKRKGKLAKRMILEEHVLSKLQGKPHVPIIYGSGHLENINYIVMQILSINVGDIKKNSPYKRLSKCSTGRIIHQMILALRDLHQAGYVHRDVKPANMCFGVYPHTRHNLILLDFGLLRRFKTSSGAWRAARPRAGFRGTTRYVSIRVHRRIEQTPYDDLCSVMYTSYELLAGELPWKHLEKAEEVLQLKEHMTENGINLEMFKGPLNILIDLFKLVSESEPLQEPDYDKLIECVKALYEPKKLEDPYDWEDDFKCVEEDSEVSSKQEISN